MTFFFDNNISHKIVEAFRLLDEDLELKHCVECSLHNVPDDELLKCVGQYNYILITKDKKISKRRHELRVFQKYRVRAFILIGKRQSRWQDIRQLVLAWEEMKRISADKEQCWAYSIRPNGKLEKLL
ncbi:MAG: DUF5615 family PIN-like protein [Candidatus Aminicenantes bacterium]|nr:DUF5615 family PIN-like protein [Candidatus Aminicenantes bacterium]